MKFKKRTTTEIILEPGDTAWDLYEAVGEVNSQWAVTVRDGVLEFSSESEEL